jgi:hypothetical protein
MAHVTERDRGLGEPLCSAEACRLRLELPVTFSTHLLAQLGARALLGAGLELSVRDTSAREGFGETAKSAETALRLCFFDVERLLVEALDFEPGKTLIAHGLLPIAGCGQRTARVYCVPLEAGPGPYLLSYIDPEAPDSVHQTRNPNETLATQAPLHVSGTALSLDNVLDLAIGCPGASLRRRLLRKKGARRLQQANAAQTPMRVRAQKRDDASATSGTLELFH